jgi:hypothetical protein
MMWFIQWLLVPGVLILILVDGLWLPRRSASSAPKASAKSGILAGLIIFLLFIISQQSSAIAFSAERLEIELSGKNVLFLSAGFGIGFLFKFLLAKVVETRILGLLTLLTVSGATISLYIFFFIKEARSPIMVASLAVLLGAFVYRMVFPLQLVPHLRTGGLSPLTADGLLRNLTKEQRIEAYSGLCEYLRWALQKQGDAGGLAKVETIIADLETYFEERIAAGKVSVEAANDIKSYKIWIIAHQESRGAPNRLALLDAAKGLEESNSEYDQRFIKSRESLRLEFVEKLTQYISVF